MKVVFLSHDSNCTGGAQKCLVDLLKGLKNHYPQISIYVIFPRSGDLIEACMPYMDGYKVIRMWWWMKRKPRTMLRKISFTRNSISWVIKTRKYLNTIKPDYGITNAIVMPHLALACKSLSIKHVWFVHEIPSTWQEYNFIFEPKTTFGLVDRLSYKIAVPSLFAKTYYDELISPGKVKVLTQSVDLDCSNLCKTQQDRYTILMAGGFDSNKGQMELLQAVEKIVSSGNDINCRLVGSNNGDESICQEFIDQNKLNDNVTIVPFSDRIEEHYSTCDVVVVCSGLETFCRVAVEAQICGRPVILSNVGANPERIKDKINGLLYRKGDVNDLVDKIEELRNPTVRRVFASQIDRDEMAKYSVESFAASFYDLLN